MCRGMWRENTEQLPEETRKALSAKKSGQPDAELLEEYRRAAIHKDVPYDYISFSSMLNALTEKDEAAARKKYPDIFRYVDLVNGCVVSVGNHPAGCVVSPYPVEEWFSTYTTSTNKYPISQINMKEIDSLNFVKLDILCLDTVGLIYKTCDLAGLPYLTPDNTDPDDIEVWESIREDTTMIFQWESQMASNYIRRLFSDSTIARIREVNPDMTYMDLFSVGNGALRPAGASYRDQLAQGEYKDNGNEELNKFLAPTMGFLCYQEQIIEFLHKFCGFTMGEADVVRRHFSKKTGTEQDIPIIKDGGRLMGDHEIKGFIRTMHDDYGVEREDAERIIVDFLQVIQDASDYLFSKNHSDPYSWTGYICGYLRYHYPLEFITTALNIFRGDEEKTLAITGYAKRQGISIRPIQFGHSKADYVFEGDCIYKGIASIKYVSSGAANDLFGLYGYKYGSFMDLLYDIDHRTCVNSLQLKILIELDFFSEFGDANYLLRCTELYDVLSTRKQILKAQLAELHISEDMVRRYSASETEKMFKNIDVHGLLREAASTIKVRPRTLGEKIASQLNRLGYIEIADERYANLAVVLSVDTKYTPKLKLHSLRYGTTQECKLERRVFNADKLKAGDIIRIAATAMRNKSRRTEDGTWEPVPDQYERWITSYKKVDL